MSPVEKGADPKNFAKKIIFFYFFSFKNRFKQFFLVLLSTRIFLVDLSGPVVGLSSTCRATNQFTTLCSTITTLNTLYIIIYVLARCCTTPAKNFAKFAKMEGKKKNHTELMIDNHNDAFCTFRR